MAIIFTITGGLLGFLAALIALMSGAGVAAALSLWSGAGMGFMVLGLTLAMAPRREPVRATRTA